MECASEFTAEQIEAIKRAVRAGRSVMAKRGAEPLFFADAFIKTDGIQIPGIDVPDTVKRQIGSCVLTALADRNGFRPYPFDDPEGWAFDAMVRETNRANAEVNWFSSARHPDCIGFRVIARNAADIDQCSEFLAKIDFGLGPGIFPKDEIAVLPACCDRSYFDVVFSDEIN